MFSSKLPLLVFLLAGACGSKSPTTTPTPKQEQVAKVPAESPTPNDKAASETKVVCKNGEAPTQLKKGELISLGDNEIWAKDVPYIPCMLWQTQDKTIRLDQTLTGDDNLDIVATIDGKEQKIGSFDASGTTVTLSWNLTEEGHVVVGFALGGSGANCGQYLAEMLEWNPGTDAVENNKHFDGDQCDDAPAPAWTGF